MDMSRKSIFTNFFSKKHSGSNDELSAKNALQDLCIYLVFLLITTIITMSSREIGMYYFNQTIERLFLSRVTFSQQDRELIYEDLVTVNDWWSFAETTLIESIDQFEQVNSTNKLAIGGNVLLGVPRLRQIRVKNESCSVDEVFRNQFKTCYGHYSKSSEDVGVFLNTKHSTQSEVSTYTVWGLITHYHGSGFIKMLTFDKEKNGDILSNLKDKLWIDSATRVILIEFVLFNANVNLFCNAKLLAEIPPTGGIITSSHLQSLKYSPLWNDAGYLVFFCSMVFFGLILYYTLEKVRQIMSIGCVSFFGSVFNILDFFILLIAYPSMAYTIWHTFYLKSILNRYAENENQYFSLDVICFWNLFFIDAMGICVFITWIQIFKYIKFNKTMMQFSTTLQRCTKDLLGFSIMFSIVFIAYAYLSVLLFGSVHSGFCDFSTAVLTLMRAVLGDFDYEKLEAANRVLGPIYFLSFILFIFFILMNMFLAIINDTYSDVKSQITHGKDNQFEKYLKSLLTRLKKYFLPAKKKDDDFESQMKEEPKVASYSMQPMPSLQSRASPRTRHSVDTKRTAEQSPRTKKEIIESFFEIVSTDRIENEDTLNQRVTRLEEKFEKVVHHLDEVLDRITSSTTIASGRSP